MSDAVKSPPTETAGLEDVARAYLEGLPFADTITPDEADAFANGAAWAACWLAGIIGMAEWVRYGRICWYCSEWVPRATEYCGCSSDLPPFPEDEDK